MFPRISVKKISKENLIDTLWRFKNTHPTFSCSYPQKRDTECPPARCSPGWTCCWSAIARTSCPACLPGRWDRTHQIIPSDALGALKIPSDTTVPRRILHTPLVTPKWNIYGTRSIIYWAPIRQGNLTSSFAKTDRLSSRWNISVDSETYSKLVIVTWMLYPSPTAFVLNYVVVSCKLKLAVAHEVSVPVRLWN